MQKIELMAPAGNFESLQAALDNGADSVYFGVEQLNMRARASINFTLDNLPEIAKRCKAKNVRTYLTLNTIIYDHDLSIVKTLINKAKEAGITAVIAMDQAVIMTAREVGMEVHISTQINITNIETVKFYALFADTMVLSRELSLRQVKKITEQIEKEQINYCFNSSTSGFFFMKDGSFVNIVPKKQRGLDGMALISIDQVFEKTCEVLGL